MNKELKKVICPIIEDKLKDLAESYKEETLFTDKDKEDLYLLVKIKKILNCKD